MARLVLLNGAPGVGKTTVARRWADDHPLSLVLDLDLVRSCLGATNHDVTASYLVTRDLAVAMADVHLRAGHDVVVPQYLGRPEFVARLEATAAAAHAAFVELVLVTDATVGRTRFDRRGDVPQLVGADETWEQMHARLTAFLGERPAAVRIDAGRDLDATVRAVSDALAAGT